MLRLGAVGGIICLSVAALALAPVVGAAHTVGPVPLDFHFDDAANPGFPGTLTQTRDSHGGIVNPPVVLVQDGLGILDDDGCVYWTEGGALPGTATTFATQNALFTVEFATADGVAGFTLAVGYGGVGTFTQQGGTAAFTTPVDLSADGSIFVPTFDQPLGAPMTTRLCVVFFDAENPDGSVVVRTDNGVSFVSFQSGRAPAPECRDQVDNGDPEDELADVLDPGCHTDGDATNTGSYDPDDDDETDAAAPPQCSDGLDNDQGGATDFPADPGCDSADDDDETSQCQDTADNDADQAIDFPNDPGCESPEDNDETDAPSPECSDGLDNDQGGAIDFPADEGCSSPEDNDETSQCQDGADNDGGGATDFPADEGCSSPEDDDETSQCQDGTDNDEGGATDFPADPGCDSPEDNDETSDCQDTADNDADQAIDFPADPGCDSPEDDDETDAPPPAECDDGVDNDQGGATDFPADEGCSSPEDDDETSECQDGVDNDQGGATDFPADEGCSSPEDDDETSQCQDTADNDADQLSDFPDDPGCDSPEDNDETDTPPPPQCSDGADNDQGGATDFPADPGCDSPEDDDETSDCQDGADNDGDGATDHPADPGCDSPEDDDETGQVTRTQGFWSTHKEFTTSTWNDVMAEGDNVICGREVGVAQMFGGFWADVSKKSDGQTRTTLDQARMQLLQQLLAAKLNAEEFGVDSDTAAKIEAAEDAICGTHRDQVLLCSGELDAYNNSGDGFEVSGTGKSDPKGAKAAADRAFWDAW